MLAEIEAKIHEVRRRMSRSEWAIRHWKLPVCTGTEESPGLLLIQIDGLSRVELERALEKGEMPYLAKLLGRDGYEMNTFYSGLPSTTPAVQAELYYGVKTGVPAFFFQDRATGELGAMYDPERAREFEGMFARQGEGLLKGGSSWSNMYCGGATPDESHFCAGAFGQGDVFRGQGLLTGVTFVLMQLPSLLRLLGLVCLEMVIGVVDILIGLLRGQPIDQELGSVLSRMCVGIGLRELIRVGAKVDVTRGLPIVHMNLLGYDEMSHRRGPASAFAHWSLRGIDQTIEAVARSAHRSQRRDYQVWIFSDHGQERTRSFATEFSDGLRGKVRDCLDPHGESKEEIFSIAAMGPVGHVYFKNLQDDAQKEALARALVAEQVPAVMFVKSDGEGVWVDGGGVRDLKSVGECLQAYPDALRAEVVEDIQGLCRNENAGDLILLGSNGAGECWTFAPERGAHAGLGLREIQGFLLTPPATPLPKIADAYVRPCGLRAAALQLIKSEPGRTPARARARATHHLRVITYNVHSCRGMDGRTSPRRIARVLAQQDADIIALQELDHGRQRSRGEDQATLIADLLGYHVVFCPTVTAGSERYGHAVLSRLPLETVKVANLPCEPGGVWPENRGALWTRVALGERLVNIVTTHLGLSAKERFAQMSALLGDEWLGPELETTPTILCGDFNFVPGGRSYRLAAERMSDACGGGAVLRTFSSNRPTLRLDHIFVTKNFAVDRTFTVRNQLTRISSDHLPLGVDLAMRAPD